jgi:hypothetical protein
MYTALLPLTSGVLRRCLLRYGGPRGLAEDGRAAQRLYRWGKGLLSRDKAEALVASARRTAGVSLGYWDEERLRRYSSARRRSSPSAWPRSFADSRDREGRIELCEHILHGVSIIAQDGRCRHHT